MKTNLAMVLVILLGIGLGSGVAVLRIKMTPWNPQRDESAATAAGVASPSHGPAPKVVVERTEYQFGTLAMQATGTHDFLLTNTGDAPLALQPGPTSDRSAWSKIDRDKIPPGESAKVTLTWRPKGKPGPYRQTATILTSDPARPQVMLTVTGHFITLLEFYPPQLVFRRLSVGETANGQSQLFCYADEPLKVLGHKWSDEATASHFDATLRPLSAAELKKAPSARSGMLVTVTVKPGLWQGPIQQYLCMQTNLASLPKITLPIQGIIASEIAVVGHGWDPDTGILTLGRVPRSAGLQRRVMLVVRGPLRKQVEFKPIQISPSALKVTFGQRSEIAERAVVQTPLIIDVPQGSAPANHIGSDQGKLGEIILATTHPQVPKLRIFVRFVIEG